MLNEIQLELFKTIPGWEESVKNLPVIKIRKNSSKNKINYITTEQWYIVYKIDTKIYTPFLNILDSENIEEWVKFAEFYVKYISWDGKLQLYDNGYDDFFLNKELNKLNTFIKSSPNKFSHIKQISDLKIKEFVIKAENIAKENNGYLPSTLQIRNLYGNKLANFMSKNKEYFRHIPKLNPWVWE